MAKIGIFDSGLGGLSIMRQVIKKNPEHSIVYLGDTARLPYGPKSPETILNLSQKALNFLIRQGVELIIVACNTVSSVALPALKEIYKIPVIGVVEAGVEAAVETGMKRIGIIGTHNTINSGRYDFLLKQIDSNFTIIKKPCPLFVSIVEEGIVSGPIAELIVEKYLEEFKDKVDVLILACTHFPALRGVIGDYFNQKIKLVDASFKITDYIKDNVSENKNSVSYEYFVTDRPENFRKLAALFLENDINTPKIINLD